MSKLITFRQFSAITIPTQEIKRLNFNPERPLQMKNCRLEALITEIKPVVIEKSNFENRVMLIIRLFSIFRLSGFRNRESIRQLSNQLVRHK